jgi:hypothetical protein
MVSGARNDCYLVIGQKQRNLAVGDIFPVRKGRDCARVRGQSPHWKINIDAKTRGSSRNQVSVCMAATGSGKITQNVTTEAILDLASHTVVDQAHIVLKRLIQFCRERNIPIKIVLMKATIDPRLLQEHFKDEQNLPAPLFSTPGRSFPVEKHFLKYFIHDVVDSSASWIFERKKTSKYLKLERSFHGQVRSTTRHDYSYMV